MTTIEDYVNCNLKPMEITSSPWLYECSPDITQKYPIADGKWMFFYHKPQINGMWNLVKTKYRVGMLEGIHSIKVSTLYGNPRAMCSNGGVILFYCGPWDDEERVKYYGRKLLEQIPYTSRSGFVSYKSDAQTMSGTRATGQKRNFLYTLPCPRS
ncbi:unnamed protein product [Rotaria magnacalcarata]|uniref:Uncharacterized protein n=1 Tax=Rotaria magnacalcarata TaxID=392030 RepID=A0A814LQI1_9BILA|nr:unnamed protein product [Rotaria magnacalcarata]CAF1946735.1 unnamed protein product [Rotaria magnacalcarata]